MFIHKRVRVRTRKTTAYVNNKDLFKAIIEYQKVVKKFHRALARGETTQDKYPEIPRYIGECIMLICTKLSDKPNFYGYSYKEEMIGDAIEKVCVAVKNFDAKKSSNPFAYFTQIAYNAYIYRLNKEKDQSIAKAKNFERMCVIGDYMDDGSAVVPYVNNEYTDDLIRKHESRLVQKKKFGRKPKKKSKGQK